MTPIGSFLPCVFLLLLRLFSATGQAQSGQRPHLFKVGWPPAFGRVGSTWLTFYRAGVINVAGRRSRLLGRRHVLQGRAPFTTPPPPEWLLLSWLPGNYTDQPSQEEYRGRNEPTEPFILRPETGLYHLYGNDWLEVAALDDQDLASWYVEVAALYRNKWDLADRYCDLQYPGEFFRLGAVFLRRHLFLGQWLAEAGITPDDRRPYQRLLIEMALAAHLGGTVSPQGAHTGEGRHFRLYCIDMNAANRKFDSYEHYGERVQLMSSVDHPLNNMLYSVVVCVDPAWQGEGEVRFVPCPPGEEQPPGLGPRDQEEVPCEGSYLYYFRTLDDGIDQPFLGKRQEPRVRPPAPKQSHIFATVWPPAYGRIFTGLNVYRQRNPERRREYLPFIPEALQEGPNGVPPLPPWMLWSWLPSNYDKDSEAEVAPYERLDREQLTDLDNEGHFGENGWVLVTARRYRDRATGRTLFITQDNINMVWQQVHFFHCDQFRQRPADYFRLGSKFLRRHLPVGQWLEEAGIVPSDTRPYHRRIIEAALAIRLGGGIRAGRRHFILYCVDMNVAEDRHTLNYRIDQYLKLKNHKPPDMLFSVVVCVDPDSWQGGLAQGLEQQQQEEEEGAPGSVRFVPCPDKAPFFEIDNEFAICMQKRLYYYRTLNDGIIDRPL